MADLFMAGYHSNGKLNVHASQPHSSCVYITIFLNKFSPLWTGDFTKFVYQHSFISTEKLFKSSSFSSKTVLFVFVFVSVISLQKKPHQLGKFIHSVTFSNKFPDLTDAFNKFKLSKWK